jgi:hypothetical protein
MYPEAYQSASTPLFHSGAPNYSFPPAVCVTWQSNDQAKLNQVYSLMGLKLSRVTLSPTGQVKGPA